MDAFSQFSETMLAFAVGAIFCLFSYLIVTALVGLTRDKH